MKLLAILALMTTVFVSCSDDTVTKTNESNDKFFALGNGQSVNLQAMLSDVAKLENLIATKRMLKYSTDIDKDGIKSAIYSSKVGLILLSKNENDTRAVDLLSQSLDEYQSYLVMKRDKSILEGYFSQVALITKIYAEKLGMSVKERSWKLYAHEFSSETLAPFKMVRINADAPEWSSGYGGGRPFAKIDTNSTASETWLVSPKYSLTGVDGLKLTVENVVRNVNFAKTKIMVSTEYNGGDPRAVEWEEFTIEPEQEIEPGAWTDVTAGPYSLDKYAGKEIVIGFKLETEPSDSFTWELLSVEVWGVGSRIESFDYPISYETPVPVQQYDELSSIKLDAASKYSVVTLEGTPAEFQITSRNDETYTTISGHQSDSTGTAMIYTQAYNFDSVSKAGVQFRQAINFYKDNQKEQNYIKVVAFEKGQAENVNSHVLLNFAKAPMGTSWTQMTSEELELPSQLQGKEVSFGFIYKSEGKGNSAAWNLYELKIFEMDTTK